MSREATLWVWEHSEARENDRIVLLAIANEADSEGLDAKPSQRRMAQLCRLGQSTIRRRVERLEAAGELLVNRPETIGPGHYSRYAVVMGRDPAELARLIGWPAPRLVPEVQEVWEQLTLEAQGRRDRHAAHGYERANLTRRVAPYPVENAASAAETAPERAAQGGSVSAPERADQGGADPQSLDSSDRPSGTPSGRSAEEGGGESDVVGDLIRQAREARDRGAAKAFTPTSPPLVPIDPEIDPPDERERRDLA